MILGGMFMNANTNRIYGYARVSTKDQNLDRQIIRLEQEGVLDRDIFRDEKSGKNFDRPMYQALKHSLRKGDILVICELDRLGRDYEAIKQEWNDIISMGVNIRVLDMPMLNTENRTGLENKLINDIVFELLSYVAEKERLKLRERQRQGIEAAKLAGKRIGRPKVEYPKNWGELYELWQCKQITAAEFMRRTGLKRTSFYKLVELYKQNTNADLL